MFLVGTDGAPYAAHISQDTSRSDPNRWQRQGALGKSDYRKSLATGQAYQLERAYDKGYETGSLRSKQQQEVWTPP